MRIFLGAIFFLSLLSACSSSTTIKDDDNSDDVKDIKKAIKAYDFWIVDKDAKSLKNIFTEDAEAIVYPVSSEVWKGAANIRKKLQKGIDDISDADVTIRDQVIKVAGNIAWFSERFDTKYDYNGQRISVDGLRNTGVLIKEGGSWKFVQVHSSNPVRAPKEQQQQQ